MDVDRRADRPLYLQLADVLRAQIHDGHFPPGERLPSESALLADHDVSRGTVRDAIGVLRSEGLVVVEHGRGAFVSSRSGPVFRRAIGRSSDARPLLFREDFEADAARHGQQASIRRIDPELLDGVLATVANQQVPATADALLCFIDGTPVQAAVLWHSPGPPASDDVVEDISTRMPTRAERRLLQIDDGVPVLQVHRTLTREEPDEISIGVMPADRARLTTGH